MKVKIDKNGNLWLERAGKMKAQFCHHHLAVNCGDWCTKFREPHYGQGDMRIELCGGNIWRVNPDNFTDERTGNTQES